MKKIFTLLFCVGAFATSFAQTGHQNKNKKNNQYVAAKSNADYNKFDDQRFSIYTFSEREKELQIAKINNDFNLKVKSVISNRRIKRNEKKMLIKKALSVKAQQIEAVNDKFNSKYNTAFNQAKKNDSHRY